MSGHARKTPPRLLEVFRTTDVSPRLRGITLGGPALAGFPAGRDGAHLKAFFPRGEQTVPELPTLGPDGPIWPPPSRRPVTRTYSVRRFDPVAGELDIEFVLHADAGPASAWALRARPGDRLGIAGPGGPDPMLRPADHTLFAGDLSALPAIRALVATLPAAARATVLVSIADDRDILPIESPALLSVHWLDQAAGDPDLPTAMRTLRWPAGSVYAWIAGENAAVVDLRTYLRSERGVPTSMIYATPYWKATLDEEAYHEERHRVMDAMELA